MPVAKGLPNVGGPTPGAGTQGLRLSPQEGLSRSLPAKVSQLASKGKSIIPRQKTSITVAEQTQNNIVMALIDEGNTVLADKIAKIDMGGVSSADDIAARIRAGAGEAALSNSDVAPHIASAKQVFDFQKGQGGNAALGTLLGGAALLGGTTLSLIPSTVTYQRPPDVVPSHPTMQENDTQRIKDAIAFNETRGETNKYGSRQSSNVRGLGDAVGKYRVTEGEFTTNVKRFLPGESVTFDDFRRSPTLQERYMDGKIEFLRNEGWQAEDIISMHFMGMSNRNDPEAYARQKHSTSSRAYLESAMPEYNRPQPTHSR